MVLDQIRTIDKLRVIKSLGSLSDKEIRACKDVLRQLFVDSWPTLRHPTVFIAALQDSKMPTFAASVTHMAHHAPHRLDQPLTTPAGGRDGYAGLSVGELIHQETPQSRMAETLLTACKVLGIRGRHWIGRSRAGSS